LFFNELLRVIAHGHLHLMGMNDKPTQEQLVMRAQEERWIASFQTNTP
jgi:ssRNA-specific RNase YbeY (16S rRNA maturation enzyme)